MYPYRPNSYRRVRNSVCDCHAYLHDLLCTILHSHSPSPKPLPPRTEFDKVQHRNATYVSVQRVAIASKYIPTSKPINPIAKSRTMNVNDLLSSPPVPSQQLYTPNKRSRSDTVQVSQDVPVPSLPSLIAQCPNRDSLYAHLATLPKPILISMLLTQAKNSLPTSEAQSYGSSNNLAHCVYCHKLFDKTASKNGCKVEHFGELEEESPYDPDTKMWYCCGLIVRRYEEYDEDCHPPPEEDAPQHCWKGKHFDKELEEDGLDAKGSWWKEWKEYGRTCENLGCHKKPNGGHRDKKSKRR